MLPQFVGPCRRRVWSNSTPLCWIEPLRILPFKLSAIGGRALPVAAAQFWNRLPDNVTSANSLLVFWQQLKHTLFQQSFGPRHYHVTFLNCNIHSGPSDCLGVRGKTIRSVLCNIVCNNCAQCDAHTYEQTNSSVDWVLSHWAHFTVLRFIFVLCITVCCMHT